MSNYSGQESDSRGLAASQMKNLFELKNGRVINILDEKTRENYGDYDLFDTTINPRTQTNVCLESFTYGAVKNIHSSNELSEVFFSDANLKILQNQIRYTVYKISKGKHIIGEQSEKELNILRRSIYLQHGEYLPNDIKPIRDQVRNLNSIIVDYSVGRIMGEIEQYYHYVHDVENMYMPLEHPVNLSTAGSRTLKSVTSTF
jgi:hypothetical protein